MRKSPDRSVEAARGIDSPETHVLISGGLLGELR